jgi:hypothetical protein
MIVINAKERHVYEVNIHPSKYLSVMQNAVEGYIEAAMVIKQAKEKTDDLYVNEEGLLKSFTYGFGILGAQQTYFTGNGVIAATDNDGETVSTDLDVNDIKKLITFYDNERTTVTH